MRLGLTDDQVALREAVHDLLSQECPPEVVRAAWPGADGADRVGQAWAKLAGMGLLGAAVPEAAGGLGLTEVDLSPLLTEVGYAAVPLPVAETVAVAAPLLAAAGDPGGHLAAIVAGHRRVAIVTGGGLVPYGARADLLLWIGPASARLAQRAATPLDPVATMDGSRAAVRLRDDPATVGTPLPAGADLLARTRRRRTLATAAQLVGLGRRLLDLTVGYVRDRRQFGAPIGSFQAVAHPLADVLLRLELAGPAVLAAAWAVATGAAAATTADAATTTDAATTDATPATAAATAADVPAAAVLATEAAHLAARTALQCHGAMGYTVEYDLHLYAKRVWALGAELDGVDAHLDQIGDAIGLPPATTIGGERP